jgi:ABC-2 type transport system permease protein
MKIYLRPRTWVMIGLLAVAIVGFAVLTKSFIADEAVGMLNFMSNATYLSFLVLVFSVVIASDIVAGEFTWGTIKLLLIRPVSRWKILLSKYIAVLLFMLLLTVVLFVVSLLSGMLLMGVNGPGDANLTMGGVWRSYGFELINQLLGVTFAFMLSTVFRSSVLAISLSFAIMFASGTVMQVLIALKKEWAKYILFANTDLSMYFGGRTPPFESMTLGFSILMLALYYIVFVGLAWIIFGKRDVAG